MLLWLCAVLSGLIAWAANRGGQEKQLPWWGLSIAFLLMGLDEFISIHERLTDPVHLMLDTRGMLRFAWVIPYGIFAVVFAVIYARFLVRLPEETRKYVTTAALLFIGGAIGWELLGSAWIEAHGRSPGYYLLAMVEELLEMAGCILFIYAFLNHLEKHVPGFCLRIASD